MGERIYRKLIGGRGLGSWLLYHSIEPGVDPFSPENVLIIASGPLNATKVPLASKLGIFFKSPLTEGYGESYIGGTIPPYPKWAGFDAIVIKGRAEEPIYLLFREQSLEFTSAKDLWGKSIYETEEILLETYGKRASILSIGPAGENLVRYACISNNKWRQAGRSGGGSVMGSKRLKAIVFDVPKNDYEAAKKEEFEELVRDLFSKFKTSAGAKRLREFGTSAMTIPANEMGFFPTRYWSNGMMENWEKIGADAVKFILVRPHPCYNCPIACGRFIKVNTKWGTIEMDGLEYETINTLGGQLLIDDIGAVAWLNDLADKLGLDTISVGNVLGFAIEAYKRGKIKTKIEYNDPEAAARLIQDITYRRGDGKILAEGVARAAKVLGLEDIAIHVKGQEPPAYDPRRLKGMILGLGTSPRGACHLRMMAYYVDLKGWGGGAESTSLEKVKILVDFEDFMTSFDSLILCKFGRDIFDWETMVKLFNALTGFDFSLKEYKKAITRITTLTRVINSREGMDRRHDRLPKRLIKESITHLGNEYKISEDEMERMLDLYYEVRGYDRNGIPTKVTLENLEVNELLSISPF